MEVQLGSTVKNDSRATHHTTSDAAELVDGSDYTWAGKLTVGNSSEISAVFKLARDNRVFLEFHADYCVVRDERTGVVLLRGREVISMLGKKFSLKDLGELGYFLGVEVHKTSEQLVLSQRKFIRGLLEQTGMLAVKSALTPMVLSPKLTVDARKPLSDAWLYRSIVGSLLYLSHTRPDIAFIVNRVAQYMHRPCDGHWLVVKRILCYLNGTLDCGLVFRRSSASKVCCITAFADADWASNVDDRRSVSGSCVFLGCNLVSWSAKRQKVVARSTTEAEYRSIANTVVEVVWVKSLLTDIGEAVDAIPVVWSDNTSVIAMSANPIFHARSKYIELDIHFVREKVECEVVRVNYVPADHQVADDMTKPLAKSAHMLFSQKVQIAEKQIVENDRENVEA
ncbi:uncharacterized mitochondrial protein AtMg00810-like [Hibiscus syriacus]|uniref:uncharacterized mitochondrial protein AtMg00810-like n=1 Tax=Hibiscus syriacus TaxID=106335 RepID=UPI0019219796|nr:uncharacterized mitochondrial protein AtMg00810-like [Hibiscus syriacus]